MSSNRKSFVVAGGGTALVPKLRFPEFQDANGWRVTKLNSLLFEAKHRNRSLELGPADVLSVSGEYGCVNQIEFMGRSYAGVTVKDYHVVEHGDIVYTKSPLKKNPFGIIKENKGKRGIVSTLYAVYRPYTECSPTYLDHFFSVDFHLNAYLQPIVRKGAKNDMKVNNADVLKGQICVPSLLEQQKIAECLDSADVLIAAQGRKVKTLRAHKKGLMQQLFPQEGETQPRLRFAKFQGSGNWKLEPLGKLAQRVTAKNLLFNESRVLTNSAEHGVIDQFNFFDREIVTKGNLGIYCMVALGDFVYNPRVSTSAPVGPVSRNNLGTGVMSPLYTVFRFKSNSTDFFVHLFKTSAWHPYLKNAANSGARHDRMNIAASDFMSLPLPICNPDEQQHIADCLNSLDSLIAAETRKLDALKVHKKGLMQQLFPQVGEG
jgi:type I restriction enzyme S subunit